MRTVRCSGRLVGVSAQGRGVSRGLYTTPLDGILDIHLWKHYLSAATVEDGNNETETGLNSVA